MSTVDPSLPPDAQPLRYAGVGVPQARPAPAGYDPNDPEEARYHTPGVRRFVLAAITATILITLAAVCLIFFRGLRVAEPTTYIVVRGDASYDGAIVRITSDEHPEATVTLTKENGYVTPVLLHPGSYDVEVRLDDRVVQRTKTPISLRPRTGRGAMITLPPLDKAGGSSTTTTDTGPAASAG